MLSEFLDGSLAADAQADLHRHIRKCGECRALVGSLTSTKLPLGQELAATDDLSVRGIVLTWSSEWPRIEPPSSWAPPDQVDEYKVEQLLGCGAMGLVYRGQDTHLERAVAIKFLVAREPDAATYERFLIEARALARLHHPNVVTCYRVGEVEGRPYLVSEFISGLSLDKLTMPLPWEKALNIGLDLARGLEAAHAHGVLHRDIKPANVVLSDDEGAKLLDFGLAKLTARPSDLSSFAPVTSGSNASAEAWSLIPFTDKSSSRLAPSQPPAATAVMGTPVYMAPEVWRGAPATTRSDVYSLGALLYELCSGHPPYQAPSIAELRSAILASEPPRLDTLNLRIDPRFAAVVTRCLGRDPASRFAHGAELRTALEDILASRRAASSLSKRVGLAVAIAVPILLGAAALWLLQAKQPAASPTPQFHVMLRDMPSNRPISSTREREVAVTVTGLPADAVDLRVRVDLDGQRRTVWRSATKSLALLSLPFPVGDPERKLKVEIVVYSGRCSIAVGRGAVEGEAENPRQLTGIFNVCQDCWCAEHPPVGHRHLGVWAASEDQVWLVGENAPIQLYDGLSWVDDTPSTSHNIITLWGFDADNLWAVGGCGNPAKGCPYPEGHRSNVILRRYHGTWTTEATFGSGYGQFLSIWASSKDDVWAVGSQGKTKATAGIIAHKDQSGWKAIPESTLLGSSLNGIWGSDKNDIWLIGEAGQKGMIWHHTEGAPSQWQPMIMPKTQVPLKSLWSVWGTNHADAWTVGNLGNILHWNGSSWQSACASFGSEPAPDLQNLWVDTADAMWAVGDRGTLVRWEPNRGCWTGVNVSVPFCEKATATLWGIWAGGKDIWATGGCGSVLHYRAR